MVCECRDRALVETLYHAQVYGILPSSKIPSSQNSSPKVTIPLAVSKMFFKGSTTCLLFLSLVCVQIHISHEELSTDVDEAREFLANYGATAKVVYFASYLATWSYSTNITDYNQQKDVCILIYSFKMCFLQITDCPLLYYKTMKPLINVHKRAI